MTENEKDPFLLEFGSRLDDVGAPDFFEWERDELEKHISMMGTRLGNVMAKTVEIDPFGDGIKSSQGDIITFAQSDYDFFGYKLIINPMTSSLEPLNATLVKTNRNTLEDVETTEIFFPQKRMDSAERMTALKGLGSDDLSALMTMLYRIGSASTDERHEDKSLLLSLYDSDDSGNIGPTHPSAIVKSRDAESDPDEHERFFESDVLDHAIVRLHRDGDKEVGAPIYKLDIALNIGGLIYIAQLNRCVSSRIDSIRISCLLDAKMLDTVEIGFDGKKQIPYEEASSEIYWNGQVLSELFVAGHKLTGSSAEQYN